MKLNNLIWFFLIMHLSGCGQQKIPEKLQTGAERIDQYNDFITHKKVGVVVNHSSLIGKTHLVDTLIIKGIEIHKIFTPEHGLFGTADAGKHILNNTYRGIEVVSLYGSKKKPEGVDMKDLDILIFDIQDVGCRFYTYLSSLHYIMEACAENHIPLIILDRPNPNGNYIDGPVLKEKYTSFIGMHPVPIVHGLTLGEFALMINGEKWLENNLQCDVHVIPCHNYTHSTKYDLPVNPSPNLKSMRSIYLYPGMCLFEGTIMSVGRGTHFPFEVAGHPDYPVKDFSFTPVSMEGSDNPKYQGRACYGFDLRTLSADSLFCTTKIPLSKLVESYKLMGRQEAFFTNSFNYLAGNGELQLQLKKGYSEDEIRSSWEEDMKKYKEVRKKYLLYPDFE